MFFKKTQGTEEKVPERKIYIYKAEVPISVYKSEIKKNSNFFTYKGKSQFTAPIEAYRLAGTEGSTYLRPEENFDSHKKAYYCKADLDTQHIVGAVEVHFTPTKRSRVLSYAVDEHPMRKESPTIETKKESTKEKSTKTLYILDCRSPEELAKLSSTNYFSDSSQDNRKGRLIYTKNPVDAQLCAQQIQKKGLSASFNDELGWKKGFKPWTSEELAMVPSIQVDRRTY